MELSKIILDWEGWVVNMFPRGDRGGGRPSPEFSVSCTASSDRPDHGNPYAAPIDRLRQYFYITPTVMKASLYETPRTDIPVAPTGELGPVVADV